MVDIVEASNPLPLQAVAAKLEGRHILGDGRPILIANNYLPANPTDGGIPAGVTILQALRNHQALLMAWNSHLYVVYGALYTETIYSGNVANDGTGPATIDVIDKLLLFDPVSGKETSFDGLTDDWQKVQGVLTVRVGPSSS